MVNNKIISCSIKRSSLLGMYTARTRTFYKVEIGRDHHVLIISFKIYLKSNMKEKRTRRKYNLEELKYETDTIYQSNLAGQFDILFKCDNFNE